MSVDAVAFAFSTLNSNVTRSNLSPDWHAPSSLRETFQLLGFLPSGRTFDEFIESLPLEQMSPRQIYYAVHGRAPDSLGSALAHPGFRPSDVFRAAISSEEFLRNLVRNFLTAYPEKKDTSLYTYPNAPVLILSRI